MFHQLLRSAIAVLTALSAFVTATAFAINAVNPTGVNVRSNAPIAERTS